VSGTLSVSVWAAVLTAVALHRSFSRVIGEKIILGGTFGIGGIPDAANRCRTMRSCISKLSDLMRLDAADRDEWNVDRGCERTHERRAPLVV
jgi:hypothetical protein